MQRHSNPSNIKIQMNNFTLNLQTLLSKEDEKLLPTTNRKNNKTERVNKNLEEVSPLKVKKKTKEKDFVAVKKKNKKQSPIKQAKTNPKQTLKVNNQKKDKKEIDATKKVRKNQQKHSQHRSKSKNHKSTRLQKHFIDYDHVIESARLRTSPSQHVNYQKFNSESISKSISRSRSKSFSKLKNQKNKHTKSRSKSIFSPNNQRLNTQRSVSKIKKAKQMQTLQTEKSTEKVKGRKSSKSRQRKSIDNLTKMNKSKSRERIYTQVSDRHAVDSNHLKSDLVMMEREEKALLSHKKKKTQHYRQQSENLLSHSSDNAVLGPKFASTKFNHSKEKLMQKSPIKTKGKKLQATLSTTSIHPKAKKSTTSKKQPSSTSKVSKKQSSMKQKSSIESQFNFYQQTNFEKKKLTQEDLNDFFQKSTQKKGRKLKTEADGFGDGGVSSMKKNKQDECDELLLEKAFKKKKVKNVMEKLFEDKFYQMGEKKQQTRMQDNQPITKPHNRLPSQQPCSQPFSRSKLLHTKKLTIQTQFNPLQNKEIYFDDISKILHKHKRTESISEESRHSICRSQRSIKQEIMQSRHQSVNCQWEEKGRRLEELVRGGNCISREELLERRDQGQMGRDKDRDNDREIVVNGQQGRGQQIRYDQSEYEERQERLRNEEIRRINTEELEESEDEEHSEENQRDQDQSDEQHSNQNEHDQDSEEDLEENQPITQKISDQLQQLLKINSQLQTMIKNKPQSQQPYYKKTSHNIMHHAKSSSLIEQPQKSDNFSRIDQMIGQQKIMKEIKTFHSSQFLQSIHKRTPINSPSSYALQNKQKVLFSLNKPRKSIEEQFKIAKTLSNKKLLEDLDLLNTLEKIEKSVENSLLVEATQYHLLVGDKREDKVVEDKVVWGQCEVKEQFEDKEDKEDDVLRTVVIEVKLQKSPSTSIKQTLPTITQLQSELILTSKHTQPKQSPCHQYSNKSQSSHQSPSSMIKLLPCQFSNKQKQDSPLLSSCEQQFKRSSPINIFDSMEYNSLKGFAQNIIAQLEIHPFGQSVGEDMDRVVQGQNITQQQPPVQFTSSTKLQLILINAQQNSQQKHSQSQKNSIQARRGDYSQLSLQFQKEMEDYLRDNEKSILIPSKTLSAKTVRVEIAKTHNDKLDHEQQPKEYSSAQSDEFFYHKGTPLPLPSSKSPSPSPIPQIPTSQQNHSKLIKTQLIHHITDTLIQQFTSYLNNNKLALHKFLYYASCLNVEQLEPFAEDQNITQQHKRKPVFDPFQALEHKEIQEQQFMEYLQARIQASNQYIFNLANDLFQFIKKSPQMEITFLTNINKSFGLKPLKTLKWMRKAFLDNDQQEEEELEERQQQLQDQANDNENDNDDQEQLSDDVSQNQQLEAVLSPMLLADFDAAQNEVVFQQINQEQYYLNHAVYATLNQICDTYRPYGQNGPPVIPKHHPHVNTSVAVLQPKVMHRLHTLLSLRMGRTQFSPEQEPQKIIPQTYKKMDELIVGEQHEKWNQRNLEDLVFESKYYLAMYIVDLVFNQQVMEMFRLLV